MEEAKDQFSMFFQRIWFLIVLNGNFDDLESLVIHRIKGAKGVAYVALTKAQEGNVVSTLLQLLCQCNSLKRCAAVFRGKNGSIK